MFTRPFSFICLRSKAKPVTGGEEGGVLFLSRQLPAGCDSKASEAGFLGVTPWHGILASWSCKLFYGLLAGPPLWLPGIYLGL